MTPKADPETHLKPNLDGARDSQLGLALRVDHGAHGSVKVRVLHEAAQHEALPEPEAHVGGVRHAAAALPVLTAALTVLAAPASAPAAAAALLVLAAAAPPPAPRGDVRACVCMCVCLQMQKSTGAQVRKCAHAQVCKSASDAQVCKCAGVRVWV